MKNKHFVEVSNIRLTITLIQDLCSTKTYERTSTDEKPIVDNHCYHITTQFAVGIKENQKMFLHYICYIDFINDRIKHG